MILPNKNKFNNLQASECEKVIPYHAPVYKIAWNVDTIAAAGRDNCIRLFSMEGVELNVMYGHESKINDVCFWKNALVSASSDTTIRIWAPADDEVSLILRVYFSRQSLFVTMTFVLFALSRSQRSVPYLFARFALLKTNVYLQMLSLSIDRSK